MPAQVTYPGVYIQEVRSGVQTITGVSTSVTLFVGMALRGRIDAPERVLGFAEFERIYGNDPGYGEMTDQVRQFFLNGGQRAFIVRTAAAGTTRQASIPIENETGAEVVLTLTARDAGTFGNSLRAAIDYDTPSPEATFNLRVFRERVKDNGEIEVAEEQRFTDLSMNPADARFVERVVNVAASLVTAAVPAAVAANAPGLDPSARRIAGYSLSGHRFAAATALAAIRDEVNNNLLAAGRRIQISVDGGPFFTVALGDLPAGFGAGPVPIAIPEWAGPINLATAPAQVTASFVDLGGHRFFRVQSQKADGGSVVIRPAAGGDAAVALQLGTGQGGLEVGGFAPQRPAPSGMFASLGSPASPTALVAFGGAARANQTWSLADSVGPHSGNVTYAAAPATVFFQGPTPPAAPYGGTLAQARDALRQLGAAITTQLPKAEKWTASMQGFRLVLTPVVGTVDRDIAGSLTTAPFDLGAANQMFAGDTNSRAYRLGDGSATLPFRDAGLTGTDGTRPAATDYDRVYQIVRREVDLFNLLVLPRCDGQTDDERADLWGPASVFCQGERAFLLVDPPSAWTDADAVDAGITAARIGLVKDHAAIYWPRIKVPRGPAAVAIDPAGSVAGLMARTDANRGVWKAPAGTEADLRGVRDVEFRISDLENGVINPDAVNALRLFPAGVVVWGARTMDGFDNSGDDDYKYVPVRRLALMIEESLYRGLQFAVFEPNDEPLWAQIRLAAGAFMNNLFRQGAFAGQKASDAYFVKCDAETTTQNDINLGIVNVIVAFAPLKPAEFVIVTIKQKAGQVQA